MKTSQTRVGVRFDLRGSEFSRSQSYLKVHLHDNMNVWGKVRMRHDT